MSKDVEYIFTCLLALSIGPSSPHQSLAAPADLCFPVAGLQMFEKNDPGIGTTFSRLYLPHCCLPFSHLTARVPKKAAESTVSYALKPKNAYSIVFNSSENRRITLSLLDTIFLQTQPQTHSFICPMKEMSFSFSATHLFEQEYCMHMCTRWQSSFAWPNLIQDPETSLRPI